MHKTGSEAHKASFPMHIVDFPWAWSWPLTSI